MKPKLKAVHSPDAEDLESFEPSHPDNFGLLLQLSIGPEGQDGAESFDVVVCTADWLRDQAVECGIASLRHHILVDRYEWSPIRTFIETSLASIEGDSWSAVGEVVSRLGKWEFEDYDH